MELAVGVRPIAIVDTDGGGVAPVAGAGAVNAPAVVQEIAFKNVAFGYSADKIVIHDFSLTVPRGAVVAFVGQVVRVSQRCPIWWHGFIAQRLGSLP